MVAESREKPLVALLPELLAKYDFPSVAERYQPTPAKLKARIGFIGEFGSGKSTLINAMVGKKVLPARTDPTTATIITVEAVAGLRSPERFITDPDGQLRAVSASEFSEIATGQQPGLLVVHVEASPVMQPGLQIIDSPGMNSLVAGHSDLTLTQLSLLDGLVVCLHQEHGTVPASLLEFLGREEIASVKGRLLFVLTFADLKSPEAAEKVRRNIERRLSEAMPQLKEKPRLVFTDALGASEGKKEGIHDFLQAFTESFVSRTQALRRERHEKHLKEIGELLLTALRNHAKSLAFDESVFQQKEAELKTQIDAVKQAKAREKTRLEDWYLGLRQAFAQEADRFRHRFADPDATDLDAISSELDLAFQKIAEIHIKRYSPGDDLPLQALPNAQAAALVASLKVHSKYVDHAITLLTLAATSAITAGMGAPVATAEVAGTAAAVSQAGAKNLAKKAAKEAANASRKEALRKGAEALVKENSKGFLKKALAQLAAVIKQINPLEWVGDVVKAQWNDHEAAIHLPQIAGQLANAIRSDLEAHLERTCFLEMENTLVAAEDGLNETRKARALSLNEMGARKEALAQDIRTLEVVLAVS